MTDDQRFEEWVARYQDAVCSVAYAVLRDRGRSEECAQEAFLIAWQKLPALAAAPALPGWLCGIARNVARNALRRRKESAMGDQEPAAATGNPLDAVLAREAGDIARGALARLSDSDREVVVLYYRGEESVAAVAGALGLAPTAVKKRLQRARERLREAAGAVEASLRATRPGPAFTAGCVAALVAGVGVNVARASLPAGRPWPAGPIGAAGVIAGLVLGAVVSGNASPGAVRSASSAAAASPRAGAPSAPTAVERVDASAGAATDPPIGRSIDGAARAQLMARVKVARDARALASGKNAPADGTAADGPDHLVTYDFAGSPLVDDSPAVVPPDPSVLNKTTIRYAVRGVQPMLLGCYRASPTPHPGGTLKISFRLVSEPRIAALVIGVRVIGDAQVRADAALVACVQQSLMSLALPAFRDPGLVDVWYPFSLPRG